MDNKFTRARADDPDRCQGTVKKQQCPYMSGQGTKFCPMHSGGGNHITKRNSRIYNLAKWQARVGQIAEHEKVKSLREEIGIARLLLESIMLRCKDHDDLMLYSPKISDLVVKIEKLVSAAHRLEEATGALMDRSAAINVSINIIDIIAQHITDENILENIADKIKATLDNNSFVRPLIKQT